MPSIAFAIHTCDHCKTELQVNDPPVGLTPEGWSQVHLAYRRDQPDQFTICDKCLAELKAWANWVAPA